MGTMSAARVLVADDDVDLQDLMVRRLRRLGLSADRAQDGTAAINQIALVDYDLIVTDLYMPGASGLQILCAAKERDPHTQVLVVTGSATLETRSTGGVFLAYASVIRGRDAAPVYVFPQRESSEMAAARD
jgi:DNA-binding NtrC family response regulator